MPLICSICLLDKCDHIKITSTKDEGTLLWSNNYASIVCQCDHQMKVPLTCTTQSHSCKCGTAFLLNDTWIPPADIYREYGKYPRSACLSCKSTGNVKHDKFKRCRACDGLGGIICVRCGGTGSRYGFADMVRCGCDYGYRIRCTLCRGEKSHISGECIMKCKDCR